MDPKRDFRLPGAAALASEAKEFGISVATLKSLYKREWEDGTGGGAAPTRSQPGRAARTNPRYPNHDGTRFLDLSSDEDEDVAEAFNIMDVDGGQSTGLLYIRFTPQDVEAEKTVVRYKVFEDLVGAKGGISGKYSEWHVTGVGVLEALAYREGMKEYEPSSASSTLRGFVISSCEELERFLGLADFSSRLGWPRDFQTDIKKWPRRPPPEYAKPRTAIEAKLEAGLRRYWMKQCDAGVPEADQLVSAEIALYMRNVAHEEVTPAATPVALPPQGNQTVGSPGVPMGL
eukprot:jgi/Tetstr1/436361/TSEL_025194.t1